jgi:hypothetical protein
MADENSAVNSVVLGSTVRPLQLGNCLAKLFEKHQQHNFGCCEVVS